MRDAYMRVSPLHASRFNTSTILAFHRFYQFTRLATGDLCGKFRL